MTLIEELRAMTAKAAEELPRDGWCRCEPEPSMDETRPYQRPDSSAHGWFHPKALGGCGGITQTG